MNSQTPNDAALATSQGAWPSGLSPPDAFIKRAFDIFVALGVLVTLFWLILIAAALARRDTGQTGFFRQKRVGRYGVPFEVVKIRTMRPVAGVDTIVTRDGDPRITKLGRFLRKTKLDELPQAWNVLLGQMSLVGPRPDVPGFADLLRGEERVILTVRPGITGPATLAYRNEEALLAGVPDPESYNREVIYPDKVRMNMDYIRNYTFLRDIGYLWRTATGG